MVFFVECLAAPAAITPATQCKHHQHNKNSNNIKVTQTTTLLQKPVYLTRKIRQQTENAWASVVHYCNFS